jgi:hypothetical protein
MDGSNSSTLILKSNGSWFILILNPMDRQFFKTKIKRNKQLKKSKIKT